MKKRIIKSVAAAGIAVLALTACSSDADVASRNLSKEAENFEVARRIVFYNGITDTYMLEIKGFCSVEWDEVFTVTCKVGEGVFKKHFLERSDNVTWFAEQIDPKSVSTDRYQVNFKPQSIIPDIEAR